jgi:D-alanyl-D-alanine carboxypeptidase
MKVLAGIGLAVVAALALAGHTNDGSARTDRNPPLPSAALLDAGTAPLAGSGTAPSPLSVQVDAGGDLIHPRFKHPPRSALLFDLDTGRVLWRWHPERVLPIASLTKMMTALIVAEQVGRHAMVPVTRQALHYQGSGVGLLPKGKSVTIRAMLYGLLLPSGNDAAIALAQRAAGGSVPRFVAMMNQQAQAMGLLCTRYSSPSGFTDAGNHSCVGDLATLARAVLRVPRLARIVSSRSAVLRFPIKGHKLYLFNNNPLLIERYPGITGLKTGYTVAAGSCLVATARRGPLKLGVVLLHSPDTADQARLLLDRGFAAMRRAG